MRAYLAALAGTFLLSTSYAAPRKAPTTLMSIFIDDLGFYDTQVYNENSPTPHIGELAHAEGMILLRHYTYKYCSPTRRAFLSGRFPVHMTGMQAPVCSNWLPLDYTLLSQKLKSHPSTTWKNHFVGKGHLGYQTMDHLPINRGFDSHVGYLAGAEEYVHGDNYYGQPGHDCPGNPASCFKDFWQDDVPAPPKVIEDVFYSTNFYTTRAIEHIQNTTTSESLWIHLTYQGVHAPYVEPPEWEQIPDGTGFWDQTFGSMLQVVDNGIHNVTETLRATGRWQDAFILISSDNGGVGPGNNFPLRGLKATPWEGGTRVMAFITGGFLPSNLRGTKTNAFLSIADWYPTFCALAQVGDCSDKVERGGKIVDIDGINQVPRLLGDSDPLIHEYLPTTEEGIIWKEQYKLLVNAQRTHWFDKNDTHFDDNRTAWPCRNTPNNMHVHADDCAVCTVSQPCLFDLVADESERINIAAKYPEIVSDLAAKLQLYNVPQANASIDHEILARDYNCVTDIRPWWGNFSGPCCKRKSP